MKYYVTPSAGLNSGEAMAVDVREGAEDSLEIWVEGERVPMHVVVLGRSLSALVDGRVVDVAISGATSALEVVGRAGSAPVRLRFHVENERERAASRAVSAKASPGPRVLRSPMPGRVIRVMTRPGDRVVAGQGLVVVEAMKMENEVRGASSGRVAEVHVKAGDAVDANAPLVTLASGEAEGSIEPSR